MTTDNFCFYFQSRLIQTGQTGGQWYSDTSPFSIPWYKRPSLTVVKSQVKEQSYSKMVRKKIVKRFANFHSGF
jgi:hypothetical protein